MSKSTNILRSRFSEMSASTQRTHILSVTREAAFRSAMFIPFADLKLYEILACAALRMAIAACYPDLAKLLYGGPDGHALWETDRDSVAETTLMALTGLEDANGDQETVPEQLEETDGPGTERSRTSPETPVGGGLLREGALRLHRVAVHNPGDPRSYHSSPARPRKPTRDGDSG